MHLEDVGTTCKATMDALNNHFEPKKNVVFERHVFRQAIQETNEPLLNSRECKLVFCLVLRRVNVGRIYSSIAKDLKFDWSIQVT